MKIEITKNDGDSRTWVGREPNGDFTEYQEKEIAIFRNVIPIRTENEKSPSLDDQIVLPKAAQRYLDQVKAVTDERRRVCDNLHEIEAVLDKLTSKYNDLRTVESLFAVMNEVQEYGVCESDVHLIREEILRQILDY